MSEEFSTDAPAPGTGGQEVGGLVDQAQQRAQSLADQARTRAREQVGQRSTDLGTRASGVAEDLRSVADHLRSQDKEGPARVADQAAQRVSGAAGYLQGTDGERLLHDAEELGRKRPWAAVAAGIAVGLTASRFLKASSTERYRSSSGATSSRGNGVPGGQGGVAPGRPTTTGQDALSGMAGEV